MTEDELVHLLSQFTYKLPLDQVNLCVDETCKQSPHLGFYSERPLSEDPDPEFPAETEHQQPRLPPLDELDLEGLKRLVRQGWIAFEMHEIDEFLKFRGTHVTDPHPHTRGAHVFPTDNLKERC